jgi:hypothetical protein
MRWDIAGVQQLAQLSLRRGSHRDYSRLDLLLGRAQIRQCNCGHCVTPPFNLSRGSAARDEYHWFARKSGAYSEL